MRFNPGIIVIPEGSIDFICGNMHESTSGAIGLDLIEQNIRSKHVRCHKIIGVSVGSTNVGFCRKVIQYIRLYQRNKIKHPGSIPDVFLESNVISWVHLLGIISEESRSRWFQFYVYSIDYNIWISKDMSYKMTTNESL